jgi:catechol 2,3-dioxygenase-like lactoylglutathione lyase family enzyme
VNHLALAVSDQTRSTRFYVDYFGFVPEPEPREDGVLILHDASGFSLALGEIDEPVVLPPFLHFGCSVVSPSDVRSFRVRRAHPRNAQPPVRAEAELSLQRR